MTMFSDENQNTHGFTVCSMRKIMDKADMNRIGCEGNVKKEHLGMTPKHSQINSNDLVLPNCRCAISPKKSNRNDLNNKQLPRQLMFLSRLLAEKNQEPSCIRAKI